MPDDSISSSKSFVRRTCRFVVIVLVVSLVSQVTTALAGGGPENVVVVVNADSASSKMLANYYVHLREIPTRNVIYLNNIPDNEVVSWKICKSRIFEPMIAELTRRKLADSIDYIVYSSDFPTAIEIADFREKFFELVEQKTGRKPSQPQIYNAEASLTSLTYFLNSVMTDEPGFMVMDSNYYFRNRAQVLLRRPFVGIDQKRFEDAIKAIRSDSNEEIDAAIKALIELGEKNPQQLAVQYWLAKLYGKQGDVKQATDRLVRSIRLGWCYRKQTRADLAFEKVKDDPVFKGIVDRIPDQPFEFLPTQGFRNRYAWGRNGMLNAEPGQGNRYFLSSILSVTRSRGISERQALQQLQVTVAADESKPQGTFYFCETSDVRTTTRVANFQFAIDELQAMGFGAEVIDTPLPVQARDVIGLTSGLPRFNWVASGSKIIPGAFCDNLTSYGGAFHLADQTKATEFLAYGAAGASGTVVEPYTVQAKFPYPMIHVHYARGCSLAEAFYQSVHGPYQTILVGDALCQPWATKPLLKVTGVLPGDTIKGKTVLSLDPTDSPTPIAEVEFFVDGLLVERLLLQDNISFDTTSMSDGHHEIRLVAIADNRIETSGNVILPITIANDGDSTTLTTEHPDYLDTDEIVFKATSTFGDSIELMQNGRALRKKIGRDVEFKIPATLLGRGPVKVSAVAISETGGVVASSPVELEIRGRLLERRRVVTKK